MADRYAYIPFLGLFVAATWGLADWASSHRIAIVWQAAVSVTVIAVFSLVTTLQIRIWHDSFSLWSHALAVTDNNFVAENNMGQFLADQGSVDEAIAHFERAVRINPSDPIANLNIGVFHQKRGNFDQAIARYRAVLQLTSGHSPMRSAALRDLGMIHRQLDDYPHARQDYESCLRLNPADASCLVGAGLVDQKTGHLEAAINEYARAVALEPTDVRFLLLAQALAATGRLAESQLATEKAQQISLDLDRAQANLRDLLQ
jgi:tetratricopeptide (TPR) repeat protein